MANQQYKIIRMRQNSKDLLDACAGIITSYQGQGLRLTLRQLFYQLVTRNIITNEEKSYANLSTLVSNGRLIGVLDWEAIEDRGRLPKTPTEFSSLSELVEAALRSYRLPRLAGQPNYVELWVEKDALAGVLAPLAREFHVVLQVNKGYASQSSMWEAACRIDRLCRDEEGCVVSDAIILYLGDLDPSGEDMVRDIQERLDLFLRGYLNMEEGDFDRFAFSDMSHYSPAAGVEIEGSGDEVSLQVVKIGITPEQVKTFRPPPNPAKLSDSRAAKFIVKHGRHSYEVDALPPNVLQELVRAEVGSRLDISKVDEIKERERRDKAQLRLAVEKLMKKGGE